MLWWLAVQAHDHHPPGAAPPDAAVQVSVSPEARVAARLIAPVPPQDCARAIAIPLTIDDQSRAGTPLTVAVSGVDAHAEIDPGPPPRLILHLARPATRELTLRFAIGAGTSDLAGRDRVALLIRCR